MRVKRKILVVLVAISSAQLKANVTVPSGAQAQAPAAAETGDNSQFVSAVQFAVHERSPELMVRSHRLVRQEFSQSLEMEPSLKGRPFEVRVNGNEVAFFVVSNSDMRAPMQVALSNMIQRLNGQVQARGRSMFYRTALSQPLGGYLESVVDDTHSSLISVVAQSVPLRDLLKQLKMQLSGLSYLMPGDCADLPVDWSFTATESKPKSMDNVMEELASFFNLGLAKKNGTYIFNGNCSQRAATPPTTISQLPRSELLKIESSFMPMGIPRVVGTRGNPPFARQVYLPIAPLGE